MKIGRVETRRSSPERGLLVAKSETPVLSWLLQHASPQLGLPPSTSIKKLLQIAPKTQKFNTRKKRIKRKAKKS
jgi:hypothetical protein